MQWFHEVPTSHRGMKSANISVLGIYMWVTRGMQMYVDIHVLETVTIFIFSSAWEAVIEIISFHGKEQHTHFVLPKKTSEENHVSSTWQEMLGVPMATCVVAESTQVAQRTIWAQQPTEPICPQRGQCWDSSCISMG